MNDSEFCTLVQWANDCNSNTWDVNDVNGDPLNLPSISDIIEAIENAIPYAAPPNPSGVGQGALGVALIECRQQEINKKVSEEWPEISEDLKQPLYPNEGPCKKLGDWAKDFWERLWRIHIPPDD